MNEEEARQWIRDRFGVPRETLLALFVERLLDAAASQNLIALSTLDQLWVRHIVDSAQLVAYAPAAGTWLDIGSGAGLPGIVIAALRSDPIELVEPRRLRTTFLTSMTDELSLSNVTIIAKRVEQTAGKVDVITARAVTNLTQLFEIAAHRAHADTIWILPKGRSAHSEVEAARASWHGSFHVEQSITAPDSLIIIAQGVRPK